MKSFLKYTLATIVGIFLFTIVGLFLFAGIVGIISSASGDKEVFIKPHSILYLKLNNEIIDRETDNPFENFDFATMESKAPIGLNSLLKSLENAKSDENIDGIFMELSFLNTGIATIEEIRNALIDFKSSGKFIYTYAETMTQSAYYLASTSNKIYMNPVGSMEIKGLRSKIAFFKGTLEKLGVEPVIFRCGKFKSAIEPFLLEKMSDANKEQTKTYVQSIWNHVAKGMAEGRSMTVTELNKIANEYKVRNIKSAVANNVIDAAKYRDEVIDELVELTQAKKPEKLELVRLSKYKNVKPNKSKKRDKRQKIAIVYASGEILSGKSTNQSIGSETLAAALRQVRRDTTVKAIVFRVNSPGGSALASDVIWREVVLTKKEKPFIVSMGDLAASGGYYIACPADVIVANPTTLTGSIGVFGLMFNTQQLMNKKLGVTFDGIKTHQYADIMDLTRSMNEAEKEIIQGSVDEVYDTFKSHVADGRSTTPDKIDEIGQGRVWSGLNAKEINLVDEFGGLNKAIEIAAEKADLTEYKTVDYPKQPDPIEELIKQLTGEVKIKIMANELGENFFLYNKIKSLQNLQGIQARMDYDVEIY